ncbi:GntR family transcriptional regulator [Rhodococcus sp. HNM0569]|uniref:GntR family transcriptional regulator n=1 Tax=Rhodococcus sp. HNM0569 TaxID=2716340 RepID=UPI00146EF1A6|nr:GntR family transcriptional regulator [Rhodococcus sp. HNM0569]NLU82306.1 GntR family transcriptional regulator [Rhodococcus sp. HNM0569]
MYVDEAHPAPAAGRRGRAVEDTYTVLRERIIAGDYRPGVSLSQVRLAEELAVSRTPLREALRRLEAEHLVVSAANRGVVVAPLALRDVEDSYAIRLLVEPALLSATVQDVTDDDVTAMATALVEMKRTSVSPRQFQLAHWDFHRVILGRFPTGVRELIETQLTTIDRHQRMYFEKPAAVDDLTDVDEMLLDAVRRRDAACAARLLEFHLLDTALGLIASVEPEHDFHSLPIALAGAGIRTGELANLRNGGAVPVEWDSTGAPATAFPALTTTNLYTGRGSTGRLGTTPT